MNKSFSDMVDKKVDEVMGLRAIANILDMSFFIPTGSRFFGGATEKSDWDFFINQFDCEKYRLDSRLMDMGFTVKSRSRFSESDPLYTDPSVLAVLEYKDLVHIQVIKSCYWNAKVYAQDFLKFMCDTLGVEYVFTFHTKFERRDLWQGLIDRFFRMGL